jgi:hypothetical protein
VVSPFSDQRRLVVACSSGLPSKARGRAAPEDSGDASRPGGRAQEATERLCIDGLAWK